MVNIKLKLDKFFSLSICRKLCNTVQAKIASKTFYFESTVALLVYKNAWNWDQNGGKCKIHTLNASLDGSFCAKCFIDFPAHSVWLSWLKQFFLMIALRGTGAFIKVAWIKALVMRNLYTTKLHCSLPKDADILHKIGRYTINATDIVISKYLHHKTGSNSVAIFILQY